MLRHLLAKVEVGALEEKTSRESIFKGKLPKFKETGVVYDGEEGVILDTDWGCPTGCVCLWEVHEDGGKRMRLMANADQLQNPNDMDELWKDFLSQRGVSIVKAKALTKNPGAPLTFAAKKKPESEPTTFFGAVWGASLFGKTSAVKTVTPWEDKTTSASSTASDDADLGQDLVASLLKACGETEAWMHDVCTSAAALESLTKDAYRKQFLKLNAFRRDKCFKQLVGKNVPDDRREAGKDAHARLVDVNSRLHALEMLRGFNISTQDDVAECPYVPANTVLLADTLKDAGQPIAWALPLSTLCCAHNPRVC